MMTTYVEYTKCLITSLIANISKRLCGQYTDKGQVSASGILFAENEPPGRQGNNGLALAFMEVGDTIH
jgi:hypothetical protein